MESAWEGTIFKLQQELPVLFTVKKPVFVLSDFIREREKKRIIELIFRHFCACAFPKNSHRWPLVEKSKSCHPEIAVWLLQTDFCHWLILSPHVYLRFFDSSPVWPPYATISFYLISLFASIITQAHLSNLFSHSSIHSFRPLSACLPPLASLSSILFFSSLFLSLSSTVRGRSPARVRHSDHQFIKLSERPLVLWACF